MKTKQNILRLTGTAVAGFLMLGALSLRAYASDEGTLVTIGVEATDDNEGLTYALDTTDPEAFSENSTFEVENGSTHTIYVKDKAGNISSRSYTAMSTDSADYYLPKDETEVKEEEEKEETTVTETVKDDKSDTEVTVDVDLYSRSRYADKDYTSYESYSGKEAAEMGGGTVYDKTETDGSANGDKVFYTITTKTGDVFYMVVDQKSQDNNVYLLDQVTVTDLTSMAEDNLSEAESEETKSLLSNLSSKEKEDSIDELLAEEEKSDLKEKPKNNTAVRAIIVLLIIGAVGGAYYYLKVYREKKDEQMDILEARDRDEFETYDNRYEDDDEIEFPQEHDEFEEDPKDEEDFEEDEDES